ncbi:MAG: HD domain-containing phosphohydrolase, partial [Sedimentibacter sp.]
VIFVFMSLILIIVVDLHINNFITNEIRMQSGNINPHIKQITIEITVIVILGLILLYVSYTKIKEHSAIGADMLKDVTLLHDIIPIILYHHERVDGTGYPYGINSNKIPLEALIIAVADSYDAMTSNRPYRKALPRDTALNEILKFKGTQYDCMVVDAFISCSTENDYKMIS